MDASSHMAAVRELDLSTACSPTSLADRINAVPGLRTSTAFFSFLRDNLSLNTSAMSSNTSTPYLEPASSQMLPPPSPSPLAAVTSQPAPPPLPETVPPLDDSTLPPLVIGPLLSEVDKRDALHLIADSIAQMRQRAALSLVFHPFCLAALIAGLGLVYQYAWVARQRDLGLTLSLGSGVAMTYLLAIRYVTSAYIKEAEKLGWDFLKPEDGREDDEDMIIGAKFGDEMIGATVLRLEPATGRRRGKGLKGGRGVIRAWTTMLRYRGQGLGGDMLSSAVRVTKDRCGRDAEVGFAQEHANSKMLLPEVFNGAFRKKERRAAKALEDIAAHSELHRKKR